MKKSLSLLLAVLMVLTAFVPLSVLFVTAAEATSSNYVAYQQDFDELSAGTTDLALMEQLGWYIPSAKIDSNQAKYSIVEKLVGKDAQGNDLYNKALQVDTRDAEYESFVTIFAGDVMSVLRNSNFLLEYRLTYRDTTVDNNGYASIIYNYNEMHGSVANGEGNEAYGIAAVRMCGTGFNAVYYPVTGANCKLHSIEKDPGSPNTMTNRYDAPCGAPSLYARLFGASEAEAEIRKGTDVMANRVLDIKISYDHEDGVFVDINGVRVSDMNYDLQMNSDYRDENLWADFIARNTGDALALLVTPGVVADIDNIKVTTDNIEAKNVKQEMPALLITEISGTPASNWGEFIEIYNPNDYPVDVANYSLIYSSYAATGSATDNIGESRKVKYSSYINLSDYFGRDFQCPYPQYFLADKLAEEPSWRYASQWYYTDEEIADIKSLGYTIDKVDSTTYKRGSKPNKSNNYAYSKDTSGTYYLCKIETMSFKLLENGEYQPDPNGQYRLAHHVENWNTRYTRGSSDYSVNSMLNPGETMLLVGGGGTTYMPQWLDGMVNNGSTSTDFPTKGFRYTYKNYGLSEDTKILVISEIGVADADDITFAIGRATDDSGRKVVYTNRYLSDYTYIESFVRYTSIIVNGLPTEDDEMIDTQIGHGGEIQSDFSASYVYGVDASNNYRCGTMYMGRTPINSRSQSHVGKQADYQKVLIDHFYKPSETLPELMITEIMPHTNNLEGQDKNAFAAMELTNTSDQVVDLYKYALTRTEAGPNGAIADSGFKYSTLFKAGNPVEKGDGNGAYFYFAEDSISNPEECLLEPGETVVIWFLTADTYESYYTDDEFGFSYFRQYWINNGCPDLGLKATNGEYAVKVIAVDGCANETYNAPNYGRVFAPAYTSTFKLSSNKLVWNNELSAIYGVANATASVTEGVVTPEDVISVAYFGLSSTYYELNKTELKAADGSDTLYYANVLKCSEVPVNTGMRYVAGSGFSNRISAMKLSLKVLSFSYSGNKVWTTTNPLATLMFSLRTKSALQQPGLGILEGTETYCIKDSIFRPDGNGSDVYRYFAENRNVIATLKGAAISTTDAKILRFDSMVRLDTFATMAATYGSDYKVGTIIVKADDLTDDTDLTDITALRALGQDVSANLLYYTDDFAVLGSEVELSANDYNTEYTAIAYMEVKTADGEIHTYVSIDTTTRSAKNVANSALKDLKSTKDETYQYKVDNKWSRFTDAERANIAAYVD